MQTPMRLAMALVLAFAATAVAAAEKIEIKDFCDPADPGWTPTGGCLLREGDVTFAEFNALLSSVHSPVVVGHPAWRFEPSFADIEPNRTVHVINTGGRGHTFTEVAAFGGGFVPGLRTGLTEAPECATAVVIAPGERVVVRDLAEGNHRFQCCIHSWMHALIKVTAE